MVAIRIKVLPKGTISVEQCLPEKFTGTVEKEASKIGGIVYRLYIQISCLQVFVT